MSKFIFESKTAEKKTADVTVYRNGMVRFSRQAIETYRISDTGILWGEDEAEKTLAFRKAQQGRRLRGKRTDTTSCPTTVAQRYVGKYALKADDGVFVLVPV